MVIGDALHGVIVDNRGFCLENLKILLVLFFEKIIVPNQKWATHLIQS
jgi:hypothetical protein